MEEDKVVDYWQSRIGLRTLTVMRKQDEWGKSFAAQVNGKTVFSMGADYIPEDHLLGRTSEVYVLEKHQRNESANGKIMNYMQQIYKYPSSFELVLYASQMLQADAIRYGAEHFRRNRRRCMGTVYWQLNDCWPVASWSFIDYEERWKALHYFAKRFFAPIMISYEEEG